VLRVTVGAKRRDIGLGSYPAVPLGKAREIAGELRRRIRDDGYDPVKQRRAAKAALISEQAKALTFQQAAEACHRAKSPEFRNAKHAEQWISSLRRYAFPVIGSLPVAEVGLPHVLKVLQPIWTEKTETAKRIRGRIETSLSWAAVSGYRSTENPARWKGNLDAVLPKPSKLKRVEHLRALPWQQVPSFIVELHKREGMAARAVEFVILTAARSGEVRGMTWDEVDLDAGVWTVPADRIKAGKKHRVPLSDQAIYLLKHIPKATGTNLVFWGPRGGLMSDMSLTAVLRRMGVDVTVHGFRSSFKDWARSRTRYPDEVSELALAHVNNDATRAAYARDELLPQRTRLMRDWAKFCTEPASNNESVTNISRSKAAC
jgi:integrase